MPDMQMPILVARRCAIYTRKSSVPPLEQEITSLQSQRLICSSYVASQQHKGWTEIPKLYEDSGISGATLDRPALQEMLTDIEEGHIDVVLVYKLDRITRTLLDFVRLIDLFDRYGVTFVSITQNFDTSDSMGRLIRNILLTFAQFEREIASDRMRDKKMVMKQSGRWTGGNPPIGYDLKRGKLVVNAAEARAVECIFETYAHEESISKTHKALLAAGHKRKIWRSAHGERHGGTPISMTALHHILENAVYIGELTYRGQRYSGVHEPIIAKPLWDRVQVILEERRALRPRNTNTLLGGLLWDAHGRRMHARQPCNQTGAHRNYESAPARWAKRRDLKILRVNADQVELLVLNALTGLFQDHAGLRTCLLENGLVGRELDLLSRAGMPAAVRLKATDAIRLRTIYKLVVARIEIAFDRMRVFVRTAAIIAYLRSDGIGHFKMNDLEVLRANRLREVEIPVHLYRQRRTGWLPVKPCADIGCPDRHLVRLLARAREAERLLYTHRDQRIDEIAGLVGTKPGNFSRLVRLTYLAPDIIAAILDGTQPASLTRGMLLKQDVPLDWAMQRRILGFAPLAEVAA